MSLVCYVLKNEKTAILVFSMHSDDKIDESTAQQLEIITFYCSTKDGVDCVDEYMAFYNVPRYTRRWTMVTFYALRNIAGLNSPN